MIIRPKNPKLNVGKTVGKTGDRLEFNYANGVKTGPATYRFADGSVEVNFGIKSFKLFRCKRKFLNFNETIEFYLSGLLSLLSCNSFTIKQFTTKYENYFTNHKCGFYDF